MTEAQMLAKVKREFGDSGGRSRLARQCGVSATFITEIFNGTRKVGPKVALGMGFEKVVTYRKVKAGGAK